MDLNWRMGATFGWLMNCDSVMAMLCNDRLQTDNSDNKRVLKTREILISLH